MASLMLVACSSQTTGSAVPGARVPAATPQQDTSSMAAPSVIAAQVDAARLPEDVRDFILRQRMCRHFSRPEAEGGNTAMASATCAKADETAWKALLRKYQGDELVASVLLAERPAGTEPTK